MKNDDDDEILKDDIKEVKTGKHSVQINKENIHKISDELDQIGDDIERPEYDK